MNDAHDTARRARQSLIEQLGSDLLFGIEELPVARSTPRSAVAPAAAPAPDRAPVAKPADARPSRPAPAKPSSSAPRAYPTPVPPLNELLGPAEKRARLEELAAEIAACQACRLHERRTLVVPGEGHADADLMFIGEGPGADEDRSGRPFVGKAGELLSNIIKAMGFSRETVYIANVVKCRPPGNRTPQPDEMASCMRFLSRQIEIVAPRVICALGRPATEALLGKSVPISRVRGTRHSFGDIPMIPTFHPAYLLRNPSDKAKVWKDVQQVAQLVEELGGTIPSPRPHPRR